MIVYVRCWSQDIKENIWNVISFILILCIKQHIFNLYILPTLRIVRSLKWGAALSLGCTKMVRRNLLCLTRRQSNLVLLTHPQARKL